MNKELTLPNEIQYITSICNTLSQSKFYQKLGPSGVLAIWLTARELGLPPMSCLNGGLYTFDGKVTLSTQTINILLIKNGHRADVINLTDESCTINFVRGDREKGYGKEFQHTYTIKDAQRANLTHKDNWKSNPKDMLYNRCLASGARKHMPDIMLNLYTTQELQESKNNDKLTCEDQEESENENLPEIIVKTENEDQELIENFAYENEMNKESSEINNYLIEISNTFNKDISELIENAFYNQERFFNSFEKWKKSK